MTVEHFLHIQVGVLEHEQPMIEKAENSKYWPDPIRRLIERELAAWRERNPDRHVLRTRSFATPGQCNVELIHVAKSELEPDAAIEPPAPPISPHACMRCGD